MYYQLAFPALLLGYMVAAIQGHFVLELPTSLGYNGALEATAPCDTFDPTVRTTVTNWPTGGSAIAFITTHPSVTWIYKVALISNLSTWVPLTRTLNQTSGTGFFCEPQVPRFFAWIGLPAVLQVTQNAPDGTLYQVRYPKFVLCGLCSWFCSLLLSSLLLAQLPHLIQLGASIQVLRFTGCRYTRWHLMLYIRGLGRSRKVWIGIG